MPKLSEVALTAKSVQNAKPGIKRYELSDAVVRGLRLRVEPSGTKSWSAVWRVGKGLSRVTLGRFPALSLADARTQATVVLQGNSDGRFARPLLKDVFDEWMRREQSQNRSVSEVRRSMERDALPVLSDRRIDEISRADVIKLLDGISDRGVTTYANRLRAYLQRMFNWAVERGIIEQSPMQGIAAPHRERSRDRVLSLDELRAVWEAAGEMDYPFGPVFRVLVLTGQRKQEVAGASWEELDIPGRRWTISALRSKNALAHIVHLSEPAIAALNQCALLRQGPLIFTTTGITPISGFSKAKERLDSLSGVGDWTIHDLRRSFATHCTEQLGVDHVVVDKILNHKSGAVKGIAAVYQRGEYLEQRAKALDLWGQFICRRGVSTFDRS
jgi:integrase